VLSHSEVVRRDRSYDLGANSHIAKPHSLDALFEVVETLGRYWLSVVSLPLALQASGSAGEAAALRALSTPTHATGTPGGICAIESSASSPPATTSTRSAARR
jgi:hypothetical protein